MRLTFRPLLIALTVSSLSPLTAGCDKKPETAAAPAPASPEPAKPGPAAPATAPTEAGPAPTANVAPTEPEGPFSIATFADGRKIESTQVEAALAKVTASAPRATGLIDYQLVRDTIEDLIDNMLLAAEARASNFAFEGDPDDDQKLGEAWARASFLEKARTAVTDADLAVWFAERRGVARIWVRTEQQAKDLRAQLMDSFRNTPDKKRDLFQELKRKVGGRPDRIPDGALVDGEGRGEVGDALVPVEVARALFALEADGEVSEPVASGGGFAVVQRVGLRPATPVEKVPANERSAATEKLAAARAMALVEEHAARLRMDHKVSIDEEAVARLATKLGAGKIRHNKMALGVRKMQLERLRGTIHGTPEFRDPSFVPDGAPGAERAKYEKIREKMKPRNQRESTP
jgi:hypothetical protein